MDVQLVRCRDRLQSGLSGTAITRWIHITSQPTRTRSSDCRIQRVSSTASNASGDCIRLPWRVGLLTQTNSIC